MTSVTRWQTFPYILMWMMIILEIPQRNRERAKSMIMLMKAPEDRTDGRYDISVLPHWITRPGWITTMRNPWLVLLLAASWQLNIPCFIPYQNRLLQTITGEAHWSRGDHSKHGNRLILTYICCSFGMDHPSPRDFLIYTRLYPDDRCFWWRCCCTWGHLGTRY